MVQDYIDEIDRAQTLDDLLDVAPFLNMNVLIQCAILDIAPADFSRDIMSINRDRRQRGLRSLNGRQVFWHMNQKFLISINSAKHTAHTAFMELKLCNDNLKGYMGKWKQLLGDLGDINHETVSYITKGNLFWIQVKTASILKI